MNRVNGGFEVRIASDQERDNVFAEIWYDHELWVEVCQEPDEPMKVRFFNHSGSEQWEFNWEEAMAVLSHARARLVGEEP